MFTAVQAAGPAERVREHSLLIFARLAHSIVDTLVAHLPMLHGRACALRALGRASP